MKVAVLAGGRSSEHEVSLSSGEAVRAGLEQGGHEVRLIVIGRDGVWREGDGELALTPGRGLGDADVAFPALHGPYGEDGTIQGLLESLDVPYVGSGVAGSAVCIDKVLFKRLMGAEGVPQVDYRGVTQDRWRSDREATLAELGALGEPVFVKPARLGSSVGIVKVGARAELPGALEAAFAHDPQAIVEAASGGLEVECAVLGNPPPGAALASEPGEIAIDNEFYDYEAKYEPGAMRLIVPARISPPARESVRELALESFRRAGCAGLARVDFFVEGERVLVNELNTMPGFTPTSVYAKLFAASGIPYPELVDRLCRLALARHAAERAHTF
jgi:D-alanine-D-alanine ligase